MPLLTMSNAHAQRPEREQRERPVRCSVMLAGTTSVNDLIRPRQHRGWKREAESSRGLQVDDQFELGRLLHRQIAGLGALEDSVHIVRGSPPEGRDLRAEGDQTSRPATV